MRMTRHGVRIGAHVHKKLHGLPDAMRGFQKADADAGFDSRDDWRKNQVEQARVLLEECRARVRGR